MRLVPWLSRRRGTVAPDRPVDPAMLPAVRAEHFPESGPVPWLDRPDAEAAIAKAVSRGELNNDEATLARDFSRFGYVVLSAFFKRERLDAAWAAYEAAIAGGRVEVPMEPIAPDDVLPGRLLNPHLRIPEVDALLRDERLVAVVEMLFGARVRPFQTIMGHKGSQQRAHSDSIHMTTYPLGYLAAAWIAFEDIHNDSGPLVYYPGSHRIPYIFSHHVGISQEEFAASGYRAYHDRYEPAVADAIEQNRLEPAYFDAREGDVLLWHANLIHGGSPRRDLARSRKALVCHYFADGCVCYHDLASAVAAFGTPT